MTMTERLFVLLSFNLITRQVHSFFIHHRLPTGSRSVHQHHHHHHALLLSSTSPEESSSSSAATTTTTSLTDWVVENLETNESSITQSSNIQAGENDTLPEAGLVIGPFRILAAEQRLLDDDDNDKLIPIRLLKGRNGWGSGVHPTTRLCLEWICSNSRNHGMEGQVLLDYGCGSGILSIAALHMGAAKCIGVDVEAEALVTAERNVALNNNDHADGEEQFEGLHVREVLPYGIATASSPVGGVDVCVANILIGQLVRPSMVAAIVSNIADGGLLCLSGIRPGSEVNSLKEAYGEYMEWIDEQYAELSAEETEGSIESYGFDCGRWARLVGRKRSGNSQSDIERMSELAVS